MTTCQPLPQPSPLSNNVLYYCLLKMECHSTMHYCACANYASAQQPLNMHFFTVLTMVRLIQETVIILRRLHNITDNDNTIRKFNINNESIVRVHNIMFIIIIYNMCMVMGTCCIVLSGGYSILMKGSQCAV